MKTTSAALALLGSLLSCGSAFAHAHLVAAVPAAGATVASTPTMLSLTFTEALELKLSGATLKGPDGAPVATGAPSLNPTDGKVMSIALPTPLGAATYTVDWHAFSNDGHATHGTCPAKAIFARRSCLARKLGWKETIGPPLELQHEHRFSSYGAVQWRGRDPARSHLPGLFLAPDAGPVHQEGDRGRDRFACHPNRPARRRRAVVTCLTWRDGSTTAGQRRRRSATSF